MIGVVVDKYDCVVACTVTGYVPKFKPIKFPKVWLTIFNCGVVEIIGKVQFALGGREYPKLDACVDVGIGYKFS